MSEFTDKRASQANRIVRDRFALAMVFILLTAVQATFKTMDTVTLDVPAAQHSLASSSHSQRMAIPAEPSNLRSCVMRQQRAILFVFVPFVCWFVMLGAAGALTATEPAALLVHYIGWRGMFDLLAIATATPAVLIYFIVPEAKPDPIPDVSRAASRKPVYTDPRFWRVAPLSATCIGTAWALQGLWAALWLSDVERLGPEQIVHQVFAMGVALGAGALLFGIVANRLRHHGVRPQISLSAIAAVFLAAQFALISGQRLSPHLLWAVAASVGGATILSYGTLAEYFPKESAGRGYRALNFLHIGGAFIVQYFLGYLVTLWPSYSGQYAAIAYKAAFATNLAVQAAALAYFLVCEISAAPRRLRAGVKPLDQTRQR